MSPIRKRTGARYRALHDQFGTAGLVLSIVAIVLALGGGAYAANHATASKAKQGPRGKTGKTGPAGPAGPAGATGPAGPAGAKGENGAAGGAGAPGESVTVTESANAFGAHCNNTTTGKGGSEFKVGASTAYACNGKNGTTGFTEFLPEGKTETGTWEVQGYLPGAEEYLSSTASFNIPLEHAPTTIHYIFEESGGGAGAQKEWKSVENETTHEYEAEKVTPAPGCTGSVTNPGAELGNLCVFSNYVTGEENISHLFSSSFNLPALPVVFDPSNPNYTAGSQASRFGFGVLAKSKTAGEAVIMGTWAVTAE